MYRVLFPALTLALLAVSAPAWAQGTSTSANLSINVMQSEAGPPVNTALPVASGAAVVGHTASVTTGSWTNSPTSYLYQWYQADTGTAISGATSSTYTFGTADIGHTITVSVTAINAAGSSSPAMSACL